MYDGEYINGLNDIKGKVYKNLELSIIWGWINNDFRIKEKY